MTTSIQCHSCGSAMTPETGYASWSCPECSFVADATGPQREYNSGTPCDCEVCCAALQREQAAWEALPPAARAVRTLGQLFVDVVLASRYGRKLH